MLEIPDLRIQKAEAGYIAVHGSTEIPLPAPDRLKQAALESLLAGGDDEAAKVLQACDLHYAAARGKDDIEQLIEVVIEAPGDAYAILQDPSHPATSSIMGALVEACPDLGSSRVLPKA